MAKLTHINNKGEINMVDTTNKSPTVRLAKACGKIKVSPLAFNLIKENNLQKGDVFSSAKISGILGAKYTSVLIPLCHNIPLNKVDITLTLDAISNEINVITTTKTTGTTGVEIEALTATSIALLTIYDMIKAVDKTAIITDIKLLHKEGGKSGIFIRKDDN